MDNRKLCSECNEKKHDYEFYRNATICKKCFREIIDIYSLESIQNALKKIDKPFIFELWQNSFKENTDKDKIIGEYMRSICSLPQYNKLTYENNISDSKISNKSFIEQRVKNLKKEAISLDNKIANENMRENFGTYKNLIQSYTEILRLIERYDWQLQYSEYSTDEGEQVAVWEQNSDGNIRNHKVWNIKDKKDMYIEPDRDRLTVYYDGKIGRTKLSDSTTCKDIVDMLCNFVDINKFNIHVNTLGIGMLIGDELKNRDIVFNDARSFSLRN